MHTIEKGKMGVDSNYEKDINNIKVWKGFLPSKLRPWVEARKKYHLSHAQIQMARELGLNPKKFGGMEKREQEEWELPLPEYIEHLYEKSFKKGCPMTTDH